MARRLARRIQPEKLAARGDAGLALSLVVDARVLWGSDYPHSEGVFPQSRKVFAERTSGLPDDAIDRIATANAAALYGLVP